MLVEESGSVLWYHDTSIANSLVNTVYPYECRNQHSDAISPRLPPGQGTQYQREHFILQATKNTEVNGLKMKMQNKQYLAENNHSHPQNKLLL